MGAFAFKILGPLEVEHEDELVPVRGMREQAVLAMLLLEAGRVVPLATLVKAVWDSDPPQSAEKAVRNMVSALRGRLARAGGSQALIETTTAGYWLRLDRSQLDSARFADQAVSARHLVGTGRAGEAVREFRAALGLWRGSALAGLGGLVIEAAATRLEEQRLTVWEDCLDIELRLGRHREVTDELRVLAGEHPLRERIAGQLMLALYRAGRQAEALDAYHRLAKQLVDDLGLDACDEITRLHEAILRHDPALDPEGEPQRGTPREIPVSTGQPTLRQAGDLVADERAQPGAADGSPHVVPAQLPPATAGFVGRDRELAILAELAPSRHGDPGQNAGPMAIVAISGPAGSGKTALAVHFAHRVAADFPDGQLYIDLRGFAPAPALSACAALGQLLEGLGVRQTAMPSATERRSSLYRTILAGRRILVVLDNALSPAQVAPLLPGAPGCLVLVTSRKQMGGLVADYGARPVSLGVLDLPDAVAVLSAAINDERVEREPQTAERLAARCGFLPLALRIAAANLCADPGQRLAEMADALTAEDRLLRLEVDEGPAVSAALDLSYRRLAKPTARLFRLLGLVPGPHFTEDAVAALAGATIQEAARELERLIAMHLVQRAGRGRFSLHDLVRLFASQRARESDAEDERLAALQRLADHYTGLADRATRRLDGDRGRLPRGGPSRRAVPGTPGDEARLLAVLDDERPNLVALTRVASEQPGLRARCWELADALHVYFEVRRYVADGITVAEAGLSAALAARDRKAEAAMRCSLASGYRSQGLFQRAADEYERALVACQDSGWRQGEAEAATGRAWVGPEIDPPSQASENYQRALSLWRQIGDPLGEAETLSGFGGHLLWTLGRLPEAHAALTRAVAINEERGSPPQVAVCLINLGNITHELGRFEEARTALTRALNMSRGTGARALEAIALCDLGGVHRDLARFTEALELGHRALELSRDIGDRRVEAECRNALADCHLRMTAAAPAEEYARRALRITREIGYRYGQARAEIRLAKALLLRGDTAGAARQSASAVTLARQRGYKMLEGNALTVLAHVTLAGGDAATAITIARHAVTLLRETSHRPGEEAAQAVLELAAADNSVGTCRWTGADM